MIPRKLQVRNFMCYRENVPPLDFQGIHVACLSGDNGHGKSALLDAMTWALWGEARARHDDELIHQGQTEMTVELEFALGDMVYRVLRRRERGGRLVGRRSTGRSSLELHIQDKDGWRSLTENTMQATQARIDRLLRMDYKTFINSAFLLQGRADEFTVKPPGERKQVLADILGLQVYDLYEEQAKERARAKEQEVRVIRGQIAEIERELVQEPEYRREVERAATEEAALSSQLRMVEVELVALREEHQKLVAKQDKLDDLTERLRRDEQEMAEIESQLKAVEGHIAGYEETISRRRAIEEGFSRLEKARAEKELWDERLRQQMALVERKAQHEARVAEARHALATQIQVLADRVARQTSLADKVEGIKSDLVRVRGELAWLAEVEARRDAARQETQQIAEETAMLSTQNDHLKVEMESLREKVELLQEAEAHCPLCDQPLTESDRVRLIENLTAEGTAKGDTYRANAAHIRELNEHLGELKREIEGAERQLKVLPAKQGLAATLEKSLAEGEEATAALVELRAEQEKISGALARGEYAAEEQADLAGLLQEIKQLGYDELVHQAVRGAVSELASFETEKRVLDEALSRLDEEKGRLQELKDRSERRQKVLAADREKQAVLEEEVARLPEVSERLEARSKEFDALSEKARRARDELVAARQNLDRCQRLAAEKETREADVRRALEEQGIYEELRAAFGKKGIQAMIIETAIPEIEEEANRLLARMTDGRMHARFETQRDTQKGTIVETLDIRIADELGTRSYELYSGGEAFRINFAIRIALSKLLAHRAGARLQTLVVDEGFGTQDTQGRERLVEAIIAIQNDFERILVVTHIDELKDAFPVRIDVWKTPQGSMFAIR
jgi:exonuclease SbcC